MLYNGRREPGRGNRHQEEFGTTVPLPFPARVARPVKMRRHNKELLAALDRVGQHDRGEISVHTKPLDSSPWDPRVGPGFRRRRRDRGLSKRELYQCTGRFEDLQRLEP